LTSIWMSISTLMSNVWYEAGMENTWVDSGVCTELFEREMCRIACAVLKCLKL
jgi:hypothetical protein